MSIEFKHEYDEERFGDLHGKLQEICIAMGEFCESQGYKFILTETWTTIQQDMRVGRKTATHREKRAVDIGIRHWDKEFIDLFIETFDDLYGDLGAMNKSGERRLMVYGDLDHLDHIHVQLDRRFSLP